MEQIVEIIKVLGIPNKSQIQSMNPDYKEYKFPIIKSENLERVFKWKNMPKKFFDLMHKIFSNEKRTKSIYLLGHPFFDELRDKNTKLEKGKNLPNLFNFNKTEMKIDSKFIKERLIPDWMKKEKIINIKFILLKIIITEVEKVINFNKINIIIYKYCNE